LVAKALSKKCVSKEVKKMIGNIEDLNEMWSTMDTCYERSEKYIVEALRPISKFRKYKMLNSAAVREVYSLLRAAIKGPGW
jgi:hypothetical protein